MTRSVTTDAYGVLTNPTTLTMQRLLPARIDRVWAYLTDGDLRAKWFAAGDMPTSVGDAIELVWRNNDLTNPPGQIPEGMGAENKMLTHIIELDPPRTLAIAWGGGEVRFVLVEQGEHVLLTLTHTGIPDRTRLLSFAPGWHMHFDILRARLAGTTPEPFWDGVARLREDYIARLPA